MTTLDAIKKVTLVGALVNIILAFIKIIGGILTSSSALIADGVHSFSDLISDAAILIGAHYWTAPADDKHPYGHHRFESVTNLVIGIVLIITAVGITVDSISRIGANDPTNPHFLALLVALISILAKEILYRWTLKRSLELGSSALRANAWHHRSDALSSIPVVISVIAAPFLPPYFYLDQVAAILVSVMILKGAFDIVLPLFIEFCEQSAGSDIVNSIQQLASNDNDVKEVHAIRSRCSGSAVIADFHLLVEPHLTVKEGHEIAKGFRSKILHLMPNLTDITIHIEPYNDEHHSL
ncbi:cation diffusion facilitator family transporter [Moritella sp. Urea-trap-13]|uniref:cation diffusion facilitator family transporter n=1 Tax=Moritella sp. Urea-trap-13 TaxID=2058327 RepID=UPI000C31D6BA|nr:cation diffusion facilitator family transporter [Moritella sp. Urea-trap-13]PKH06141.1 cation transporter [Moritella sp. Urea-trap-13]